MCCFLGYDSVLLQGSGGWCSGESTCFLPECGQCLNTGPSVICVRVCSHYPSLLQGFIFMVLWFPSLHKSKHILISSKSIWKQ